MVFVARNYEIRNLWKVLGISIFYLFLFCDCWRHSGT